MRPPEEIPLWPSRTLSVAIVFAHLAAGACVLFADLPVWLKAAVVAALLISLAGVLREFVLQAKPESIVWLALAADGTLEFGRKDARRLSAEVAADTVVFGFLAVVRFKVRGERKMRSLVVMRDSVDPDRFRRLRVWLRWRATVSCGAT